MKNAFIVIGVVVALLVLIIGGWAVSTAWNTSTGVVEKTLDPDNVIYNYEWFKQTAEDLDAIEKNIIISKQGIDEHISTLPKDRTKWTSEDKEELARLRSIHTGQKMHFEQVKADFKAKSKMVNRAIFKEDGKIIKWVEKTLGGVK